MGLIDKWFPKKYKVRLKKCYHLGWQIQWSHSRFWDRWHYVKLFNRILCAQIEVILSHEDARAMAKTIDTPEKLKKHIDTENTRQYDHFNIVSG